MLFHLDLHALVRLLGYPGIFAIVFAESGVAIGFFLPGASLLFTAGILASQGFLNPWVLIPLVALAAILGDSAGYWTGSYVGVRIFLREDSRWFKHEHVEMAKDFYDRHGALAVILARFLPVVRTFAPIVAGVVKMPYRIFLTYNIAGALLWASGITFLGFFLGTHVPFVEHYLTAVIVVIVVVTTLPVFWQPFKNYISRT